MRPSRLLPLALPAAAVALAATAPAMAAPADSARPTCHGYPVTITASRGDITGTARRDVIRLTGPGHVRSGAGDDIICGSRFADQVDAGAGHDVVLGGHGHDRIRGGAGSDVLFGEGGDDHLEGGPGGDTLMGGTGRDRVVRHRERRAREAGIWPPFADTVVPGSVAVSIRVDPEDVQELWAMGTSFVFDWPPPDGLANTTGGASLAWQVQRPMPAMVMPVQFAVSAFVDSMGGMPYPGTSIGLNLQTAAGTWQSAFAIGPDLLIAPQGQSPVSEAVTIQNNAAYQSLIAGVAIDRSPALAGNVAPMTWAAFPRPTALRVRTWTAGFVRPGQWLPPLDAGSAGTQSLSVPVPANAGVVPLRYDPTTGFVRG